MNHLKLLSRSGLVGLALVSGGVLGLVAACSSDSGNAAPSTPVINTGGGGGKSGGAAGDTGDAGTPEQGGSANSNGGGSAAGDAGEAGQGGAAGSNVAGEGPGGSGGMPVTCPTSDVGFLNQPSGSQKSAFDNAKRLGTYSALPALQ